MSALADPLADHALLWRIAAANLADLSKRKRVFNLRKDVTFTIKDVKQPGTATQCMEFNATKKLLDYTIDFPISKNLCELEKTGERFNQTFKLQPRSMKIVSDFYNKTSTIPQLHFLELPKTLYGNHTMAAIATLPPFWPGGAQLYACIIDAYVFCTTVPFALGLKANTFVE